MFSNWQQEKAAAARAEEAQALSEKLASTKPHIVDSHAAAAYFWAAVYHAEGLNLYDLANWKPAAVVRFAKSAATKIAALRKQRAYDSSDGLAVWLHTARAVTEPQIAPSVRDIWQRLCAAGPNAASMAEDLVQEAGLETTQIQGAPIGFGIMDENAR